MKTKLGLVLTLLILAISLAKSQDIDIPLSSRPADVCIPCSTGVTNSLPGGWPLEVFTKQIKYKGCTFSVKYRKRYCSATNTYDMRIDAITLENGCSTNPMNKGKKSDCEWLSEMQTIVMSIMSEMLRTNPMEFPTDGKVWQLLTPACMALYGSDFFSPLDNSNIGCPVNCCLHRIRVLKDHCEVPRIREVDPMSNGGCPPPLPPVRLVYDNFSNGDFHTTISSSSMELSVKCDFVYHEGTFNCIPICGKKLTLGINPNDIPSSK